MISKLKFLVYFVIFKIDAKFQDQKFLSLQKIYEETTFEGTAVAEILKTAGTETVFLALQNLDLEGPLVTSIWNENFPTIFLDLTKNFDDDNAVPEAFRFERERSVLVVAGDSAFVKNVFRMGFFEGRNALFRKVIVVPRGLDFNWRIYAENLPLGIQLLQLEEDGFKKINKKNRCVVNVKALTLHKNGKYILKHTGCAKFQNQAKKIDKQIQEILMQKIKKIIEYEKGNMNNQNEKRINESVSKNNKNKNTEIWDEQNGNNKNNKNYYNMKHENGIENKLVLVSEEKYLFPVLKNFQGAYLTLAIVKNFIEVIVIRMEPLPILKGWLGTLSHLLSERLNFKIKIAGYSTFGTLQNNGSFSGIIGAAQNREADLSMGSTSMTYRRRVAVTFTEYIATSKTVFVRHLPKERKSEFLIFQVYHWKVYIFILAFVVMAVVSFYVFHEKKNFQTQFFTVLRACVLQSNSVSKTSSSVRGRLILMFTWLTIITLYYGFSGNLTAYLSIKHTIEPPQTVRELNEQGYQASIVRGFATFDLLKDSPIKEHQELYKKAKKLSFTEGKKLIDERMDEVQRSKVVIMMESLGAAFEISKRATVTKNGKICNHDIGKEAIDEGFIGLAMKKNSLLKPVFDDVLSRLRESGILTTYFDSVFALKCRLPEKSELKPFTLQHLMGIFYILAIGIILSVGCFVGEIIYFRAKKSNIIDLRK